MTAPRPTDDIRLVRQEHDYGCGLAALAMVTGQSYEDVREWLVANWPAGHERSDEWLVKRGIYDDLVDYFLGRHGFAWRTVYAGWEQEPWPPEPFAPVHLAVVRQPSNNSHYVVMRSDGVVLDPLTDEPRTLTDWDKVSNVRGVWRLAAVERERDHQMHAAVTWMARARAAEAHLAAVQTAIDETATFKRDGYPWTHENNIKAHIRAALAAPSTSDDEAEGAIDEALNEVASALSEAWAEAAADAGYDPPIATDNVEIARSVLARNGVRLSVAAPSPQAEPATCPHGMTEAHSVLIGAPRAVGCPGPQSTEEQSR